MRVCSPISAPTKATVPVADASNAVALMVTFSPTLTDGKSFAGTLISAHTWVRSEMVNTAASSFTASPRLRCFSMTMPLKGARSSMRFKPDTDEVDRPSALSF